MKRYITERRSLQFDGYSVDKTDTYIIYSITYTTRTNHNQWMICASISEELKIERPQVLLINSAWGEKLKETSLECSLNLSISIH